MDTRWPALRRALTRTVARHRRLLAALAATLAALGALSVLRPAPPPTTQVAVAARDLPSGTRLAAGDVGSAPLPPGTVPDGAYGTTDVPLGRLVAAPLRAGQPLTDTTLVGPGLASGLPEGQVLISVSVPSATGWLVRPGDVVDVVAGSARPAPSAEVVAMAATVVAVPPVEPADDTRPLVLALDSAAALAVRQAALLSPLDLLLRPDQ